MFKILNYIPVVGHLKASYHYIVDDTEAGNEAMYEASRSALVTVGGICGSIAGPVGMGAGAALAGVLTDLAVSDFSGKSKGVIEDLGEAFDEDGNRIEGAVKFGLTVTLDAVTGGVTGKIVRSVGKGALKVVGTAALNVVRGKVTEEIHKSKKTAMAHAPMTNARHSSGARSKFRIQRDGRNRPVAARPRIGGHTLKIPDEHAKPRIGGHTLTIRDQHGVEHVIHFD